MPHPDGAAVADLPALIRQRLDDAAPHDDPDVARLLTAILDRHGEHVAAVLLYGSYLRGKRDTLLDFYVLLNDFGTLPRVHALGNRCLPPNVYYLSLPPANGRQALRAKYATMTLGQFQRSMTDFHSYFWSRFTQPTGLVHARDDETARRVTAALTDATHRFARAVAPMLHSGFSAATFWQRGLALTYAAELRAEDPAGVDDLYRHNRTHFDALLAACAATPGSAVVAIDDGCYRARSEARSDTARRRWLMRRVQGKVLSVLRLVKAAITFDDPLDYLLWKIERHSGIYIAPTERQRRHPLIFAWPLLWKLYRHGAFR